MKANRTVGTTGRATATVAVLGGDAAYMAQLRGPLLRALQARGCRVIAICPDDGRIGRLLATWGVDFAPLALHRSKLDPFANLAVFFNLLRLLRRERPDALLAYTIKPIVFGLPAGWLAGVRKRVGMVTGLGYALTEGKGLKRRLSRGVALIAYWVACRAAQRMIFQNSDDRAFFQTHGLLHRNTPTRLVAGSGVDLARFTPKPLPGGPVTFLMIGRLLRDKGVYEYVAAAEIVKRRYPDTRFLLVGGRDNNPTSITAQQREAWTRRGTVEMIGHVDDVRPFLAQCHIFVLPSYREGTPRSCLEAMALGRAVVTTDAPGCREVVKPGRNGLLVPVRDVEGLVAALLSLAASPDLVRLMGEESRRFCEERFNADAVSQDIAAVLLDDPVAICD